MRRSQMITRLEELLDQISNTPLIQISERIYAKDESRNLTGSTKIRMAVWVILEALVCNRLQIGMTVVEATSGNSGIALSWVCRELGIPFVAIMPSNMTAERIRMIQNNGGDVRLVGPSDFAGAVALRDKLVKDWNAYTPDQFCNPDNAAAHYHTTGNEILRQVGGRRISAWVAGTGTGGTFSGVQKRLFENFPALISIAVEPAESAVMLAQRAERTPVITGHSIGGIGDGFIPSLVDMQTVMHVTPIRSEDAISRMLRLNEELGIAVGVSSGANVLAAERFIRYYRPGGIAVTVLPDSQDRYQSLITP